MAGIILPTKTEKIILFGLYGGASAAYIAIKLLHLPWDGFTIGSASMGFGLFLGLGMKWLIEYGKDRDLTSNV